MKLTVELTTNQQTIVADTNDMNSIERQFESIQMVAAVTDCCITLYDEEEVRCQTTVEICGITSELLMKTIRFYLYEMAWELFQTLLPTMTHFEDCSNTNEAFETLYHYCQAFIIGDIDANIDYLQSLEDSIRCGQVTFKNGLTDTNVDRKRLATLIVASNFLFVESTKSASQLEDLVQVIVPSFYVDFSNLKKSLWTGLEEMIGYVNSICD